MSTDLNEAKEHFIELMRSLNGNDQQKFLLFIAKEWKVEPPIFYNHTGMIIRCQSGITILRQNYFASYSNNC